ncbi:MAG: tRNA adenosine(34) deaminase TadA [Pseudomonadota bacterium]
MSSSSAHVRSSNLDAVTRPADHFFMLQALDLADAAAAEREVPVGAVLVQDGRVLARGENRSIRDSDPTAHAEVVALRRAGEMLGNYRINNATLYVTLEPCAMCATAMVHARVDRVVYGAADPKTGALGGAMDLLASDAINHRYECTSGVLAEASAELLRRFFRERRR